MRALVVQCLPRGASSAAGRLLQAFLEGYQPSYTEVVDLCHTPPPFMSDPSRSAAYFRRSYLKQPLGNEEKRSLVDCDRYLDQIRHADCVVLAYPVYNFSMPAAVKAYFDCVLMKGETFEETEHGTIGLLRDKSAAVLSVAGGLLSNSSRDHSFPLARSLLEYMGMKRIESVLAEGLDVRPEHREDIVSRMCIHSRALGASLRSELPLQR